VIGRDARGFEEQMRLEAVDLAKSQFGPELLITLGEIYQVRADIYLADELVGRFSIQKRMKSVRHSGLIMRHRMRFYQNAAGSLFKAKNVHDAVRSATPTEGTEAEEGQGEPQLEEDQRKAVEDALENALPQFLQTAWAAVVMDIDGTIKEVGRKLLKDKSVCWQIRVRRAEALQLLGKLFVEEGIKAQESQGDSAASVMTSEAAKATLHEALMGAVKR